MQYEFEQLLEDMWAGRLDDYGHRRLDELCAADPALARRLHQEENLTGLLSRCGPNYAPPDLARSVLAQLEPRTRYVAIRRSDSWFSWVFRPAVGAALAFCVMAAVGIEAGLLLHGGGFGSGFGFGKGRQKEDERKVALVKLDQQRESRNNKKNSGAPGKTSKRVETPAKPNVKRPAETQENDIRVAMKTVTPAPAQAPAADAAKPAEAQELAEFPSTPNPGVAEFQGPQLAYNVPNPTVNPTPGVPALAAPLSAQPEATPQVPLVQPGVPAIPDPSVPGPAVRVQQAPVKPAPTPAATLRRDSAVLMERQVAMEVFLTPAPRRLEPTPGATDRRAAKPLPYSQSFVSPNEAQPKAQPLSLKDIELTLYSILGVRSSEQVVSRPIAGERDAWEVRVRLTPEQLRSFTSELRKLGVLPGESVVGTSDAQASTHAPSFTTNHYEIRKGRQWLTPAEAKDALAMSRQPGVTSGPQAGGSARPAQDGKVEVRIRVEQIGGTFRR